MLCVVRVLLIPVARRRFVVMAAIAIVSIAVALAHTMVVLAGGCRITEFLKIQQRRFCCVTNLQQKNPEGIILVRLFAELQKQQKNPEGIIFGAPD